MTKEVGHTEMSRDAWKEAVVSPNATLQQAIQCLDRTALQIVLVVAENSVLMGTVTDGDIRRGLLRGSDLASTIEVIMNPQPLVVTQGLARDMVVQLMHANRIRHLPVVDEHRCLVGLHLLDELLLPTQRSNLVVIMAGGQGIRLRPHTENCPKPLLPVGGKPMLEHIIERARAEGFEKFVLALHYLGDMIEEYFGDGSKWRVQISYLRERESLGTAGAIRLIDPRPETAILVSNGDVLTDIKYGELIDYHTRHQAVATMAVRLHEWQHPFGVVLTNGVDIVGFEEKPITRSHINAGIYVLEPSVINSLNVGEACDMPTLFRRQQELAERTIVYPMHEPWLDVGRSGDLELAQMTLSLTR